MGLWELVTANTVVCVCTRVCYFKLFAVIPIAMDGYRVSTDLTLYQPMTHMCVMSSHKPIRMYMGFLVLGVNTIYRLFCFFKLFPMVGKGLNKALF